MNGRGPIETQTAATGVTKTPQAFVLAGSNRYLIKWVVLGLLGWISFNVLTGLLTGNHSLNDNYFVLALIASGVFVRTHVEVEIGPGFIDTYRVGMRTQQIDLYRTRSVRFRPDRLEFDVDGGVRFNIKTKYLSPAAIERLRRHSTPLAGSPPPAPKMTPPADETLPASHYNLLMFKGGFAILVAVIGMLSGELSSAFHGMPSGRLDPDDPGAFYSMVVLTAITGVIMVLSGAIGSSRQGVASPDPGDQKDGLG